MLHFANSVLARHKAGPDAGSQETEKRPLNDMAEETEIELATLLGSGVLRDRF
jgi:hypothetical protein